MPVHFRLRCMYLLIPALVLFAGCATSLPDQSRNPFGSIGKKADIYIAAPVKGNEQLLTAYFTHFMSKKNADRFFSRTARVYAGLHAGTHPEVRFYAAGRYPAGLAGAIFPKKNGWVQKKVKTESCTVRYFHSAFADAVLSPSQLHFLFGDTERTSEEFISRICEPEPVVFPSDFLYNANADIAVFVQSPQVFFSAFAGLTDMQLPVTRIVLRLSPYKENRYRLSARFETPSERTAQILKLLMKNAVRADISIDGFNLLLENGTLSVPEIVQMLTAL